MVLAGGLTPENVAEAIGVVHPYAVDVVTGVEAEPGRKDPAKVEAFFEAGQGTKERGRMSAPRAPTVEERFGPYGGRFVPETLIAALDELSAAWAAGARGRGLPGRAGGAAARLRRAPDAAVPGRAALGAGRPPRLSEARGPGPHRRAQDQQRRRPGAAGQEDGQDPDHRRDRRRPARRRDRHRLRADGPRVRRLHGHRGHPPPGAERRPHEPAGRQGRAGRGRRPHAEGGGERRDPRLGRDRRGQPLRDRLGRRPGARTRRWSATCSG